MTRAVRVKEEARRSPGTYGGSSSLDVLTVTETTIHHSRFAPTLSALAGGLAVSIVAMACGGGSPAPRPPADTPSPAEILEAAQRVTSRASAVAYTVREDAGTDAVSTYVFVQLEPFRFRAEQRDGEDRLIAVAVSDGETTRGQRSGAAEVIESRSFSRDRRIMAVVDEGSTHVAMTRELHDQGLESALGAADDLFYVGIDDVEGELCHVVLFPSNGVRNDERFHIATYYWVSASTGHLCAKQRLTHIRGRSQLSPRYVISDLRIEPDLRPGLFALDANDFARFDDTELRGSDPTTRRWDQWIGSVFPRVELRDVDNEPVDLVGLRGRPMLVNFWATWCGPCLEELPALDRLHQSFGDRLQIVAIAAQDSRLNVREFVARSSYSLVFVNDPEMQEDESRLLTTLGFSGLPTSFFLDVDGRVADAWQGFTGEGELADRVNRLLGGN